MRVIRSTLERQLKQWLDNSGKVALIGVGNPLRTDDAIGTQIIKKLKRYRLSECIGLFNCETVPENYLDEIKKFQPTHLILIDAAQLNLKPGEQKLVTIEKIKNVAISTHALPLSFLAKYLKQTMRTAIILLAIQPKNINFGINLTPELEKASVDLARMMAKILSEHFGHKPRAGKRHSSTRAIA